MYKMLQGHTLIYLEKRLYPAQLPVAYTNLGTVN